MDKPCIVSSGQLVFEGSVDTQLYLISGKPDQSILISFTGFLDSTSQDIEHFRVAEMLIYSGGNVKRIIDTVMKRSQEDIVNEHHSFRRFNLTTSRKELIVGWMFSAQTLENL
jgi:hypothetical protein